MKKGEYFHTSHGEYSDYGIGRHYLVLEDFSFIEQMETMIVLKGYNTADQDLEWLYDIYQQKNGYRFKTSWGDDQQITEESFFKFLTENQLIKQLDFQEFHTGSYGDFEMHEG